MLALLVLASVWSLSAHPAHDPDRICTQPSWAVELRLRAAQDRALTRELHAPRHRGDAALRTALSTRIEALRDESTQRLVETAYADCVRALLQADDASSFRAFTRIVAHSYTSKDDSPELIYRVRDWYEDWFAAGLLSGTHYGNLLDRISTVEEDIQLYGHAIACIEGEWRYDPALHDPERLEERRAEIGYSGPPGEIIGRECEPGGRP